MDLGDRKELSPYANLTNIAPWSMGSLLFPGVWQAYPASLKLACAVSGSSLLMCCYGDLAKVASTNRKEGLMLSHPENDLGNSLNEVRRTGPRSIVQLTA